MLPFRRAQKVIALDDNDIVEADVPIDAVTRVSHKRITRPSSGIQASARGLRYADPSESQRDGQDAEIELDLSDAISIGVHDPVPAPRMPPRKEGKDGQDANDGRRDGFASSAWMRAAPVKRTPSSFEKAFVVAEIPSAVLGAPPVKKSHHTPSPSPFVRSAVFTHDATRDTRDTRDLHDLRDTRTDARSITQPLAAHLVASSLAPVALSAPDAPDPELVAIAAGSRSKNIVRGIGLVIAGAVAAAAITVWAMHDDHVQTTQISVAPVATQDLSSSGASATGGRASATGGRASATGVELSPTWTSPLTPTIRTAEPAPAVPATPAEVRFDDKDAVVVPVTVANGGSSTSSNKTSDKASDKTASLATSASAHHHHDHASKPPSKPLPNALMPDDPVADAQLRAAMR